MSEKINMPGRFNNARHIIFLTLLFLAVLSVILFSPFLKGITITDYKTGRKLYCHTAGAGDSFSIRYIHSVNKSPVEDFFLIGNNDELILEKTVFLSFGAGVPASSADGGEMTVYDNRIEVTGINRRIDNFLLFVGVTAEHRFKMDKDEFMLRHISHPQRNLMIRIERVSLLNTITLRHII